jgi:hypothetical protein
MPYNRSLFSVGRPSSTIRLPLAFVCDHQVVALPVATLPVRVRKSSRPREIQGKAKDTEKETIQLCLELIKETFQGDTEAHPSMGSRLHRGKYTLVGEGDARK